MVKHPPLDRFAMLFEYLRPFVNEVVIVDTGSTEQTIETMQSWGTQSVPVRIIHEPFVNFADTRNKGLEQHRYLWTLGLDPDELPSAYMMSHIVWASSAEGMRSHEYALGWQYFTTNYWGGVLGPETDYHWHCRLWKTEHGRLYRPIHELVLLAGKEETETRGTSLMPQAPRAAYLIHSKGAKEINESDELYRSMGSPSK